MIISVSFCVLQLLDTYRLFSMLCKIHPRLYLNELTSVYSAEEILARDDLKE